MPEPNGGFSKAQLPDTTQKVFCLEALVGGTLGLSDRIGVGFGLQGSSDRSFGESSGLL